jgi:hypothetical protein
MTDFMAMVDAILNTPTPDEVFAGQPAVNNFTAGLSSGNAERTAARLRTLGLILPTTTTTLVRTDLPPKLILVDHPNGLLGSEPRREREHPWWETSTPLDELIRAENRRRERLPIVMCRPEDEPRIRQQLAERGMVDQVRLTSGPLIAEYVPEGEVLYYDPRPFLDRMDEELTIFEPTSPRHRWVPPIMSPRDLIRITGACT